MRANAEGMAALRAGDAAAAARHFAAAAEADPRAGALWRNLASAHRLLQDDAAELAALNQALDIDRTDFMAWLRRAQLHTRRGEDAAALTAWSGVQQLAAAIHPLPPEIAAQIAQGQEHLATLQDRIGSTIDARLADNLTQLRGTSARRAQAFIDQAVGRRQTFPNICAGLHYPFLPADEFFDDHHFPWFDQLSARGPAIRAELEALLTGGDAALRPYVRMDSGTPDNKWSALDHNLDWGAAFLWEYGEPNAAMIAACPQTAAAMAAVPGAAIPGRAPNVFFSILRPHTRIPPHTGVTNTRAIIHLPLIVPDGCGFRVGGETRQWAEYTPFAFDDTIEHEAWNDSDELRAVLIFDVWNPHLHRDEQALIAAYYAAADAAA